MRILGVDPGSRVTGWGLVEASGWEVRLLDHGAFRIAQEGELPSRLRALAAHLRALTAEARADVASVERVFSARHARSALVLGHARGVVLLVLAEAGMPVFEYSPMQVKSVTCGYGAAGKEQVQAALAREFGLREPPRPADAADALALAVCHASHARSARRAAGMAAAVRGVR